jgi:general secretion pathway protein N
LAGLVIALLVFAPARWLGQMVSAVTAERLQLSAPVGTLWSGSAQLTLTGGAGSNDAMRLPGRIQWQLQPGWDHLTLVVQASCCSSAPVPLRLSPVWGGLALSMGASQSVWPAKLLSGLGTPWNTLQFEGRLTLSSQALQVRWTPDHLLVDGSLSLQAHDISSRLSTLRPMGSYQLTLDGGATPRLRLATIDGSLRLTGEGQWIGSRLRFQGDASAAPEKQAELQNLLNIIGRRDGARSIFTLG